MTARPQTDASAAHALLSRSIAAVMWRAQEGQLPLFAWTLGLPQPDLLALIQSCFPELASLEPMPPAQYDALRRSAPVYFDSLVAMLLSHRTASADARRAHWAARTLAAASLGSHHLWEDMGLSGREDVSQLMDHFFRPLSDRNTGAVKWKKFLYAELGRLQGRPGLRPPGCADCDQVALCFGSPRPEAT